MNVAEPAFQAYAGQGIALAAPESSMEARIQLLRLASQYGFCRVASLTSEEINTSSGILIIGMTDVLAINLDEAATIANLSSEQADPVVIVQSAIKALCALQSNIHILLTAGARGSWAWDGETLHHAPAIPVSVASSAGAGDAHLAGLICGIVSRLAMPDALLLGVMAAALSVTSQHTIHPLLDRTLLERFAHEHAVELCPELQRLLAKQ